MALFLRLSDKRREDGKSEVLMRFTYGAHQSLRTGTRIFVPVERWNAAAQQLTVPRIASPEQTEIRGINRQISDFRQSIFDAYDRLRAEGGEPSKSWLIGAVLNFHNPHPLYPMQSTVSARVADIFTVYIASKNISEQRARNMQVVGRLLERYEATLRRPLTLAGITPETLRALEQFERNEYRTNAEAKPRGDNTICYTMKILHTFILWCIKRWYITADPFTQYEMPKEVYGLPIYLTIEERDAIADLDLSARPALERQRDIFIFQCHVGCRVSDLLCMTKSSIIDGAVEYIPHKTQEERPMTIRVPLTKTARRILDKYADTEGDALFPFISAQKYNDALKTIAELAGITRVVTRLNPTTRKQEQVRLCDIISSHTARRTFVGSAVNKIKDPRLVASLSGHSPNSKAMSRYYIVEEQTKREIIDLID